MAADPRRRTDRSRAEDTIQRLQEKIEDGLVPAELFNDPELFELEKDRIFRRSWIYLAHESEVPDPGDFVARRIVDEPFLVVRGEDGEIRVFEATCPDGGRTVHTHESGNTSTFDCPCHGHSFATTGEAVDDDAALRPAPHFDSYRGAIFANLDPDAESLDDYLGDFAFHFDFVMGRSPEGMEVKGPQRRVIDLNWKTITINNIGDRYHADINHLSTIETGIVTGSKDGEAIRSDPEKGNPMHLGPGGGNLRPFDNCFAFYPDEVQAIHERAFSDEQMELMRSPIGPILNGALFPTFSFLNDPALADRGEYVPFTYIRVVNPISPTKCEVFTWHVVERDAPEEFKQKSYQSYLLSFGASGTLTQDDIVSWSLQTTATERSQVTALDLNFQIGMDHEPLADVPCPGTVYPFGLSEVNQRYFFRLYSQMLRGNSVWDAYDAR